MNLGELLSLAIFAILAENVVFTRFLGVDPFLSTSRKMGSAICMGLAVTVIMGLTSLCSWLVNFYVLIPTKTDRYLQILAYVLIIIILVRLLGLLLRKISPSMHAALDVHLPLVITNCAVLGAALLNTQNGYGALGSTLYGIFGGLGFTLATILFTSVRERVEFSECPKAFEGFPIALVTAGLLAMAFMGFAGVNLALG